MNYSYENAMTLARLREYVRRPHWPVMHIPAGTVLPTDSPYPLQRSITRRWHAWNLGWIDYPYGCAHGWGGQMGADYADFVPGYGTDGGGYTASEEDKAATDWQVMSVEALNAPPQPGENVFTHDAFREQADAQMAEDNAGLRAHERAQNGKIIGVVLFFAAIIGLSAVIL